MLEVQSLIQYMMSNFVKFYKAKHIIVCTMLIVNITMLIVKFTYHLVLILNAD